MIGKKSDKSLEGKVRSCEYGMAGSKETKRQKDWTGIGERDKKGVGKDGERRAEQQGRMLEPRLWKLPRGLQKQNCLHCKLFLLPGCQSYLCKPSKILGVEIMGSRSPLLG